MNGIDLKGLPEGVDASPPALTPLAKAVARYKDTKEELLKLAYEEIWRKRVAGEPFNLEDFCAQYPSIADRVIEIINADSFYQANLSQVQEKEDAFVDCLPPTRRPPGPMPKPGQAFLGFDLVEELGRGGIARVFLAREPSLGNRLVVVKIAPQELGSPEAKILGQLSHTNIVPVLSVREDEVTRLSAVCMPYVAAVTLEDVILKVRSLQALPTAASIIVDAIREIPLDESRPSEPRRLPCGTFVDAIRSIGAQLADALTYIHARRIFHRDLKPSNILMDQNGTPMLIDFNLSADPGATKARHGGTPIYMPPEQLLSLYPDTRPNAGPLDERTDIFSLGVILYQTLTCAHPFTPLPRGPDLPLVIAQLLERQKTTVVKDVCELNPAVDRAFANLVHRCLAYDPKKRPQSAAEVARILRRGNTLPQRARRWFGRNPRTKAALAMAVVASLFLAAAVWLSRPPYSERQLAAGLEAYQQKQFDEAVTCFNTALQADPKLAPAFFGRGRAYQQMAMLKNDDLYYNFALADYRNAQSLAWEARTEACIGYCFSRIGHYDKAISSWQKAIDEGFQPAAVFNNLGRCLQLYANVRRKESLDNLERAIRLDPNMPAPYHNRALIYLDLFRDDLALLERQPGAADNLDGEASKTRRAAIEHNIQMGAQDLEKAFALGGSSIELCYDAARYYAVAAQFDRKWIQPALQRLATGVEMGLDSRKFALDYSLSSVWNEPAFQQLVANPPASPEKIERRRLVDPVSDF